MKENNILIVTFSKDNRWTEIAALAVVEELLSEEKIYVFREILKYGQEKGTFFH